MCVNECLLFRGEYRNLDYCSKCNEARYVEDTVYGQLQLHKHGGIKNAQQRREAHIRNTPRKVYPYFPISNRLVQLFNHPVYSRLFQYADDIFLKKKPNDDTMGDICHSEVYKQFAHRLPLNDPDNNIKGVCDRRIAFLASIDGTSMSTNMSPEFSLTPIILCCLSFPPRVRRKHQFLFVTGLTPKKIKLLLFILVLITYSYIHSFFHISKYTSIYMHTCMHILVGSPNKHISH